MLRSQGQTPLPLNTIASHLLPPRPNLPQRESRDSSLNPSNHFLNHATQSWTHLLSQADLSLSNFWARGRVYVLDKLEASDKNPVLVVSDIQPSFFSEDGSPRNGHLEAHLEAGRFTF